MESSQGRLVSHVAAIALSPTVINAGLAGMVALVAAAAWYAVFHGSASIGRLFPQ